MNDFNIKLLEEVLSNDLSESKEMFLRETGFELRECNCFIQKEEGEAFCYANLQIVTPSSKCFISLEGLNLNIIAFGFVESNFINLRIKLFKLCKCKGELL